MARKKSQDSKNAVSEQVPSTSTRRKQKAGRSKPNAAVERRNKALYKKLLDRIGELDPSALQLFGTVIEEFMQSIPEKDAKAFWLFFDNKRHQLLTEETRNDVIRMTFKEAMQHLSILAGYERFKFLYAIIENEHLLQMHIDNRHPWMDVELEWMKQRFQEDRHYNRFTFNNAVQENYVLEQLKKAGTCSALYDFLRASDKDQTGRIIWRESQQDLAFLIDRLFGEGTPVIETLTNRWRRAPEWFIKSGGEEFHPEKLQASCYSMHSGPRNPSPLIERFFSESPFRSKNTTEET